MSGPKYSVANADAKIEDVEFVRVGISDILVLLLSIILELEVVKTVFVVVSLAV